jgi:hypothetical protein
MCQAWLFLFCFGLNGLYEEILFFVFTYKKTKKKLGRRRRARPVSFKIVSDVETVIRGSGVEKPFETAIRGDRDTRTTRHCLSLSVSTFFFFSFLSFSSDWNERGEEFKHYFFLSHKMKGKNK